jgi:hypothetical protein
MHTMLGRSIAFSVVRRLGALVNRRAARFALMLAAAGSPLATVAPLRAQSLESRIAGAGDGTVQLRFASRPGVCGDGRGSIGTGGNSFMRMNSSAADHGDGMGWCAPGPVRVLLDVRGGAVNRARVVVGGNDASSGVHDLGTVGAREAADYFLALAGRAESRVGNDAILAAVLADSTTPWPALYSIVRGEGASRGTRQTATFWLSRAAAAEVNHRDLFGERDEADSERDEVRNAAIFALSQQPHDEGVPALIRVARGNGSPVARDKALFWLGQSGDARALDLFAQILDLE